MIKEKDKIIIKEISKKYGVKRVLIFGSSLDKKRKSNDIDIAVEGIAPKDFFKYYGDLLLQLSKPVDVIDLSSIFSLNKAIFSEGGFEDKLRSSLCQLAPFGKVK